jgi:hypothetical protein
MIAQQSHSEVESTGAAILNWESEGDIFLFPSSFLPRRFPAATREAAPKNEAGKGKNEEFQLRLRIAATGVNSP